MKGKLPLQSPLSDFVSIFNKCEWIGVRAAVDMPTGLGEDGTLDQAIKADFTYSTGIAKSPIINNSNLHWTGRLRYLDLGFLKMMKILVLLIPTLVFFAHHL